MRMLSKRPGHGLCVLLLAALLSACATGPKGTLNTPAPAPSASLPAPSPAAPAALSLAGTEWVAFALNGVPEVTNPKPKLRWTSADKIAGTGGCNGFTGLSVVGPNSLSLGPLASTGRACLSMPGSQEDLFFKALELTRKARMDRDQLVLMDETGKQLARFLKTN
ncbi:MAG: META domain-containing protein [Pseudomonadota bacterium]